MSTSRTDGVPVSVVDRVSLVLDALSAGPMTLAKVTARTGLPRSSAHRLLEQLANAGWLARSPEQTYELGVKAYEMGQAALNQNRLLQHARPVMHAFAQRTGITIQLGVVDRGDTVYLTKINGRASGSTPTAVGQRVPAHLTALGKVVMAHSAVSGTSSARGLHGATESKHGTPTASSRFEEEMALVRDRGAAFDRGEAFPGIACVGVSIGPPDHMYGNLAALSVCAPVGTFDHQKMVAPLRMVAGEIWQRCVAADLAAH
ncbi:IclR family transcriptional regulator [Rhodococcus sp. NPDC003382]|uniref:IclR family transcriptional regulator n=1 Tax=unclassified Rhodococcus (in: high G+C Gram-positive bacteria) TaxID=192944 RepID=UPI001E51032B|nr:MULTISPECIES: IclR family transcriptional regulator [unclassified Rhodococcus (in: high G+C Gram-positive bacteria)]MCK8669553.1 IclR family transcriptional regulator [Rhodococcus sp. HM1]